MVQGFSSVSLRQAYRLLHPRPVVIVTTRHEDVGNAMAASWVTPVSFSPPLVAVSIAPERFTHELIEKSGVFALNVPDEDLLWCVHYTGTVSGRDEDKLETLRRRGVRVSEGRKVKVPVILDSLAVLECEVQKKVSAGDHTLFVGLVVESYAREDCFMKGLYVEGVSPLMHAGFDVYTLAGRRFRP